MSDVMMSDFFNAILPYLYVHTLYFIMDVFKDGQVLETEIILNQAMEYLLSGRCVARLYFISLSSSLTGSPCRLSNATLSGFSVV